LLRKELKEQEIATLSGLLAGKKEEALSIELTLAESTRIAGETEERARLEASRLQAEAEAVAAFNRAQMLIAEKEIAGLNDELDSFSQLLKLNTPGASKEKEPAASAIESNKEAGGSGVRVKELKLGDGSIYTIKLVSFINARHFVSFGQKAGPVHAHSWQAQIEVKVPAENTELVAFAKIFDAIKSVLSPYENVVLNHVPPFNRIQPSTENLALYLYNRLEDSLTAIGLGLGKLSVWETPTRGIEVDQRYPEIDIQAESIDEEAVSQEEVAATADIVPFSEIAEEMEKQHSETDKPLSAPFDVDPPRGYFLWQYSVSVVVICMVALIAFHPVLFPAPEKHYPWGSDSWGHLFKAQFLYEEIKAGNFYPQFTEYWYNGSQPFRYWAPLPYYVLAAIRLACGDIFVAGNYYVVLCALFGGLCWLFMAGRMGLWPATMAGALWVVWLDNVRVAFSEGNLPRVLATALLPLLFVLFYRVLEKPKSFFGMIFLVVLVHLLVICHAMIAAVYCICLSMFGFWLWVFRGCGLKDCIRGTLAMGGGVATAAWWLLPSITGGITEIDADAVKTFIQFVPAAISFDPFYRFENPETFYWGVSIIAALAVAVAGFRSKPPWAKSLLLCSIVLVLITFPVLRMFYIILPLSHLMWPLRFTTVAVLGIIGSGLAFRLPEKRQRFFKSSFVTGFIIIGLFAVLFVDSIFSVRLLAHTGSKSFNLMQSAEYLKKSPGWRVATVDLSRLGSAPSFIFSEMAGLEQVFGWAWQGAVTSSNIMLLNTGLEMQYYPFLLRSCVYLGATELVVNDDEVNNPDFFRDAAVKAGYRREATFGGVSIWHGFDRPYLLEKPYKGLVIGKYAGVVALQFPEVEMATSKYIDDYSLEYLKKYPVVIITGAQWWSKEKSEELITKYVEAGGRAFVDLAGMPQNVLSKQPEFLGVHGETVVLEGQLALFGDGRNILLQPFPPNIPLWKAFVPLVLDEIDLEFRYFGSRAPVIGYKRLGNIKVGFFGGNITYYSFLTNDPSSRQILRDVFRLRTDYSTGKIVPLTTYRVTENGYVMSYQTGKDFEAIIPIAAMDGARVEVDGSPVNTNKFENLLQLNLPGGSHEITIQLEKTPVYRWGAVASAASAAVVFLAVILNARRKDVGEA